MRIKTTISMVLLGLWLVAAPACSKDDKDKADPKGDKADKSNKAGKPGVPDLAAVKAIDCEKACTGQLKCAKATSVEFGTPAPDEGQMLSACKSGCDMLKSDVGSTDLKLTAGARMLDWAAGKCD